jgi:catechol 2,3-dioxygenase-like lactoylglutathione lyase family enzyme
VDAATGHFGVTFTAPQVILFSADVEQAGAFYRRLGFRETFRVPEDPTDPPIHVDLVLGDYKLGFASMTSSRETRSPRRASPDSLSLTSGLTGS